MKFRRFDKDDWMAYSGCTGFADGLNPWIAYGEGDFEPATVIIDSNGIQIDYLTKPDDFDNPTCWNRDFDKVPDPNLAAAVWVEIFELLPSRCAADPDWLRALGFECINGTGGRPAPITPDGVKEREAEKAEEIVRSTAGAQAVDFGSGDFGPFKRMRAIACDNHLGGVERQYFVKSSDGFDAGGYAIIDRNAYPTLTKAYAAMGALAQKYGWVFSDYPAEFTDSTIVTLYPPEGNWLLDAKAVLSYGTDPD